ncbi:proline--tRNA ligase [Salicibibacter halophilus]|uniref:Proline--tRNA ligase n=1 Tax=Salicibibacter halophilus TaxID=2502791 RepID=A0A514LEK3_9BACI|nr:proline--tRNA ligase [Salicibibacter halophilus]QDI90270.1 proline--tRNA ligase [Salicibibacter halophilus]
MRQQTFFSPTMRDIPADAEAISHQLMLRAGLMRQTAAGIYTYLPLGTRVLHKIQAIIREEMNRAGAQELLMPAIQPAELWEESGRLDDYGPELMRLNDRHERRFVLGPTHEEVITAVIRDGIHSYKRLPINVYQIQTKYRDERRPRFGLLRGREFIMKDAYSFETSEEALAKTYEVMYDTYTNIFRRCGLDFRAVEADAGAIGGTGGTHEFMALSDIGEDTIAYSDRSDYAANTEIAAVSPPDTDQEGTPATLSVEQGYTSGEAVASAIGQPTSTVITSRLFYIDEAPVLILTRGDHEISDVKITNHLDTLDVEAATADQIQEQFGTSSAFIGPVEASSNVKIVADQAIRPLVNAICGGNQGDTFYVNADHRRDFHVDAFADLRIIQEGDPSPDGEGTIHFAEGIEVGQVFSLGTKYSEALGAEFLDENGKSVPMQMGCYGIGISRTLAAVVEQHHDEDGIIWPKALAPFDLHLLVINPKDEAQLTLGDNLYEALQAEGYDVLYDDRKERAGVKFKDADLYGMPIRIAAGKKASEGIVEVKERKTGEVTEVQAEKLPAYLSDIGWK